MMYQEGLGYSDCESDKSVFFILDSDTVGYYLPSSSGHQVAGLHFLSDYAPVIQIIGPNSEYNCDFKFDEFGSGCNLNKGDTCISTLEADYIKTLEWALELTPLQINGVFAYFNKNINYLADELSVVKVIKVGWCHALVGDNCTNSIYSVDYKTFMNAENDARRIFMLVELGV